MIRIAAAVIVDSEGRTLLIRKRGTEAFMQAGGKLGDGETALEALRRELGEELGCGLAEQPRPLGRFTAPAANEADHVVEAELFAVALDSEARPAAEIAEIVWHHPDEPEERILAPLTRNHVLPLVRGLGRNE